MAHPPGQGRAQQPPARPAARALVVDPADRLLLFKAEPPGLPPWWFAPGGALEAGESPQQALLRELAEETGLAIDATRLAAPVWTRDVMFSWEGALERHLEWFFLVRVRAHEARAIQVEPDGAGAGRAHRWWTLAEIEVSDDHFAPRRLAEHLRPLLAGTPADWSAGPPVDVGV